MKGLAFALSAAFLLPALWGGDSGKVQFERLAEPGLDRYTNSPSGSQKQWFRDHFMRMMVFSPYFDNKISWFSHGLVYLNLYGVPKDSPLLHEHPDWILRDQRGSLLYIPWNCGQGTCPQYAGDIANPQFRAWWIARARTVLAHGYFGLWIDDVNTEFRVSDGTGKQIPPIDSSSGRVMSWDAWRNYVAEFVEQIRAAFPQIEITHNSIWFAGPPGVRDADPAIQRQIRAADYINIERGIANDRNLTGGTDIWSIHALFAFVDRVHAAGRAVTLEEYELTDRSMQQYALAGYFLISSGNDRLGDTSTNPDNWWGGYDVDLGTPAGPRTDKDGIYQRTFSCGMVLLGEPGLRNQTVSLKGPMKTLDGQEVESVSLSGRVGIVLRSCTPKSGEAARK